MQKIFEKEYRVMYHDADMAGRLSLPSLGSCALDAAGLHAIEMGISMESLARRGLTWVMSGIRISARKMPPVSSMVTIRTGISGLSRISSRREFVAISGGQTAAEISSDWLIIDTATRRPVFLADAAPPMEDYLSGGWGIEKCSHIRQSPGDGATAREYTVQYSDIDVNSHLYSMRYLQLAINCLEPPQLASSIKTLEASFVQEALLGETVELISQRCGQLTAVEMSGGGKVKFRAMIETGQGIFE